ncbi:MAG: GNAT family N-acetyltransferase [Clostridiales bacterium]|nr:GNAT family N-acetyltransferase [Clostridiales bacterium]
MTILNISKLSEKQIEEVRNLEVLCKQKETLQGSVFLSNELNYDRALPCFFLLYRNNELISFLSLFLPSKSEAEVYAYTHPDYRQIGAFNTLLEAACKVLMKYSVPTLLFVTEPKGKAASKTLETLEATFINSEYLLTLKGPIESIPNNSSLLSASIQDLKVLSKLHSQIFNFASDSSMSFLESSFHTSNILSFKYIHENIIIGLCHATIEESFISIFGVGISPDSQGKHHGITMMLQLLNKLKSYDKPITLEVSSENKKAFHLYERLGFIITTQFDYFIADTEEILEQLA